MDEQRLEAYLNLIQLLLSCSSGQEVKILYAHRDLIDEGFLQLMERLEATMAEQGHSDGGLLQNLKARVAATLAEYLSFLMEVLRTVTDNPDPQVVYPLLERNLDKLDENLGRVLQGCVRRTWLPEVELEHRESLANVISNFCKLVNDFPLGSRSSNLEIVIAGYEVAAEVYSRKHCPVAWAMTQNNLGTAYVKRIQKERSENLERAIACCQAALEELTRERFPVAWAKTQNNLGIAYWERINGERKENIETAIACLQAALEELTRERFPVEWADTQNNLGNAYCHRINGERKENIERAIACYQATLEERTHECFPVEWADTQNNLGNAYCHRIKGEREENIEKAIACYEAALAEYTQSRFPIEWAKAQNNLGKAYSNRIKGERSENLERAIACCQSAVSELTASLFPVDWATIQLNLGTIYSDRIKRNTVANMERAIARYKAALTVFTPESFPVDWARTQSNLGKAYLGKAFSNSILEQMNLEEAISCCKAALKAALTVFTPESFPVDWAIIQSNLGIAYFCGIFSEREKNLEEVIACYQNALQIFTPTTFPLECLNAGGNLGNTAFTLGNWELAIKGYSNAIAAVEQSRSWATNDERRQEILAKSIGVYEKMVQACINNGQLDKAMEYAERSRSQRLVDLMAGKNLDAGGDIDPQVQEYLQQFADKQQQIDQLRQGNNTGEERELAGSTRSRAKVEEANEIIQALEREKQQIWQQIRQLDPVLSGQIQVAAPDLAAMQKLIDDDKTAILSFYTTTDNTHVFVLRKDGVSCHSCQGQGYETLQVWIFENWLKPYVFDKPAWRSNIGGVLGELAHRLRLSTLVAEHLEGIEELIIVPHLYLHQIPFGAMPIEEGKGEREKGKGGDSSSYSLLPTPYSLLGDQFLIRYVPSCQILEYCRNRPPVTTPTEYGTVEDATEDLPCSSFEGEQIAQLYQIPENRRHRGRQNATVANYRQLAKQVQGILSTHHAQSRLDNPLHSELLLADGSITLGELLTPGWRLPQLVDVFLSCCETGLGLPETLTDDILTLSFGFLCAGARSVVSTLWAVDDLATALFSLFYHRYKKSLSRPAALRQAQQDLRTLTGETLATEYKPLLLPLLIEKLQQVSTAQKQAQKQSQQDAVDYWKERYKQVNKARNMLDSACKEAFPFSDYFYWAAFTCHGLR